MNSSIKELCPLSEISFVAMGSAKDPSTWIYRGAHLGERNLFAVLFGPVPVQDIQPIVELANMAFAHGFILCSEGKSIEDRKEARDFINDSLMKSYRKGPRPDVPFERILVSTDLPIKGSSISIINLYKNNKRVKENLLWQLYGEWDDKSIRRLYEHAQVAYAYGRLVGSSILPQVKDLIRRAFHRGEVVAAWQNAGVSVELRTLLPL